MRRNSGDDTETGSFWDSSDHDSRKPCLIPNEHRAGRRIRKASSADRQAISEILAEQDRMWAAGDADGYAARALPEIVFTNVVGAYSVGKAPFLAQVRKIFSTIYKGSRTKTSIVHISLIGRDVALVDTISKLRGFVEPGNPAMVVDGATYSRLQQTMVRRQGGWWVASIHNVFIIPALVPSDVAPGSSPPVD